MAWRGHCRGRPCGVPFWNRAEARHGRRQASPLLWKSRQGNEVTAGAASMKGRRGWAGGAPARSELASECRAGYGALQRIRSGLVVASLQHPGGLVCRADPGPSQRRSPVCSIDDRWVGTSTEQQAQAVDGVVLGREVHCHRPHAMALAAEVMAQVGVGAVVQQPGGGVHLGRCSRPRAGLCRGRGWHSRWRHVPPAFPWRRTGCCARPTIVPRPEPPVA